MSSTDIDAENTEKNTIAGSPVSKGQSVRIGEGPLEGFEGIVIDRRPSGRYLVQLFQGVYVETALIQFDASE